MKKTILGIFIIALSISAFGQSRARSGISVGDHKATGTNIFVVDSITKVGGSYAIYDGADTLDPYIPVADQVNLSAIVPYLADTIPFASFAIASMQAPDTAAFVDNAWAGSWCNTSSDTLVTTIAVTALGSGSGTETLDYNICVSDTCGAIVPTKFFDTDETTTAVIPTKGDVVTSFDNFKIAPYQWGMGSD